MSQIKPTTQNGLGLGAPLGSPDLLVRMKQHRSEMAPHQLSRREGKLFCEAIAEVENLRNELECQLSNIAEIIDVLGGLVKQHEDWNESVQKIIGRPVGWNDSYLDAARHILANA